jgi:hypothetical protein
MFINSIKKSIEFYKTSEKKNNLLNYSLSDFCFYLIGLMHLQYILGIFILMISLMKFIKEQNNSKLKNESKIIFKFR